MAEFKIVVSDPKCGRSKQMEIKDDNAKPLLGLKIGDKVNGNLLNLEGYEFEITGGSDIAGFPMKQGISGVMRKRPFMSEGVGFRGKARSGKREKGIKARKLVCGNTIHDKIVQINLKVVVSGKEALFPPQQKEEKEKVEKSA